ncbi:Aste57867_5657 [Aphanomyces stellatus]|uniref:Aste57867_5657 protein n=1 Tax=Aphanomyces stellatus TaxID=120398 RepID=A0A485KGT4_9STRA|nr:hypothetical protein As57867_005644 [Aphanomyces stellatus]VFT82703.1 Aste57867_5657 [Aphanomyces stellatus]
MATHRGYTLPFPIVEALDKLHFIISNNSINSICGVHHALQPEDWDLLVDDGLSDSDSLLDDDDRLVNDNQVKCCLPPPLPPPPYLFAHDHLP